MVAMKVQKWRIKGNKDISKASGIAIRGALSDVESNLNPHSDRSVIQMAYGDPSASGCFRAAPAAEDAVVNALRSAQYNGYAPTVGILTARQAIADYVSRDINYKLSADDVSLTLGANQAIEVLVTALATPGANILLPRPGYPNYESWAAHSNLEVRHFGLLPEKGWEVDLDVIEALADENTVAIVIINPGNPCGNVYTNDHLRKVAKTIGIKTLQSTETARKFGVLVIADEVYDHLTFGSNPFVPMGTFGRVSPVITLSSLSKRWIVPERRLGWLATIDPADVLSKYGLTDCIKSYLNMSPDPPTFIQGAVPEILKQTKGDFFAKFFNVIRKDVDISWKNIKDISCLTCPYKPQGGMFAIVKLDTSLLDGIANDIDFCHKLAKGESVIVLPGSAMGAKGWLRITIALEPRLLEEAFERLKIFFARHAKKQQSHFLL